ncbi:hypothetical protein GCM10010341_31670 [Streptomyces noursei]|nr:hypothetical protein GCM10010341_31670 [Streptomyces noursei]
MGAQSAGPLVVGVDSSTQSTKTLVVDAETGEVLARGQAPHTVGGAPGKESDPRQWWRALGEALAQCGPAARQASAISVAGQQHGLVTLDATGEPVRPALLWNDVRPARESARLIAEGGGPEAWAERTGSVPGPAFTVAKWAWLCAHEPAAAAATAAVRLPHDYLVQRLTGQAVTDRGDASGTGWWAGSTEAYDPEVLDRVGLTPSMLPRVALPGEAAGTVRTDELPLPHGALVSAGTGDNMAAALGLGLRPGQPVLSLGTSGTVYAVTTRRPAGPPTRPAPSPASPTPAATGCRWPARSTARSPWTGWRRCSAATGRPSSRAATPCCCPSWTASARRTSRAPPACCTACATTPRPASCSKPPTTARCSHCCGRWTRCRVRRPRPAPRCC